ncbi:hypothetical protein AURDEDRAFT_74183, partial [Auricularia subglabra TFB-10046 SS5]
MPSERRRPPNEVNDIYIYILREQRTHQLKAERLSERSLYDERSISFLPVGPPVWARLPTDTAPTAKPLYANPGHLSIGTDARCRCGSPPDVSKPLRIIPCTIYSSLCAFQSTIEIRPCASCHPSSRQYAGPDLRHLGLFNFNNRRLFTHEVLDGFTNSMTATETPFNSYHTIMVRKYEGFSPAPFVSNRRLRTAWYSFSRIQDLSDSFMCEPEPLIVIFDGVTAGFDVKHVTESLRPPTMPVESSVKRVNV